eukprot:scaffold56039_cov18-Tisochrysis_lutea.AAC.1
MAKKKVMGTILLRPLGTILCGVAAYMQHARLRMEFGVKELRGPCSRQVLCERQVRKLKAFKVHAEASGPTVYRQYRRNLYGPWMTFK